MFPLCVTNRSRNFNFHFLVVCFIKILLTHFDCAKIVPFDTCCPNGEPLSCLHFSSRVFFRLCPAIGTRSASDECAGDSVILYDQNGDDNFVDDISRPPTSIFSWPPPPEDDSRNTPTAAPLYIPPPGTQHIKPKVYTIDEGEPVANSVQVENVIDMVPASWLTQQSRSAPELTTVNLKEHNELTESCSEGYTSTCTTTTTTSDEYLHRMYNAQSILTQSQCYYDQSSVDLNSNYDYEVASFQHNLQQYHQQQLQQQQGSFSSASTDLISFNAGRRSVQDCTDSLYNTVNTCQLVDYIRSATPNPSENHAFVSTPRLPKKVEFADTVKAVDVESVIQSADLPSETLVESSESKPHAVPITAIPPFATEQPATSALPSSKIENPVPKEWTSLMVRALTTASPKPFQIPDVPVLADCSDCPLDCKQKCAEAAKTCDEVDIEDTCGPENAKSESTDATASTTTAEKLNPWELIESKKPPIKGFMASLLTTAPTTSIEWTKPLGEVVPMPEETVPYFPPPISMEPIERLEPKGTRSPFCEALTVAPLRSFTPFENDVITQFEDLPKTKEEIKFVDALTTAPIESVQKLNAELPDETEMERLARIEAERLERQAAEVRKIIEATVETQLSKNISAFATVRGFRSVDPFKPMSSGSLPPSKHRSRSSSIVRTDDQSQSNACPKETVPNNNSSTPRPSSASTKRPVAFPPPAGLPAKSYIQSGLQSPKVIPKYQRQWFNLPSQSPIRTPEPPELKENVPLAFVDVPHEQTDQISKPFAVTISAAAASVVEATKSSHQSTSSSITKTTATSEECKSSTKETATIVPSLNDKRTGPITMTFQTIDENQLNEPARSATPSLINKPAPMIPYYQQNLVAEYCAPTSGHLFDPRTSTPSPRPDLVRSPAPGPPPNPLKIQAPRIKPLDALDQLIGVPSIITGESAQKCQINSLQSLENAKLLSETKRGMQIATQSFQSTPPSISREQRGDQTIETHSQSSQLNQAQKSNLQSSSTVQIGNTQIQRNRRVVEEYEHTQKASTVENYKSSEGHQQCTTQTQNAQAISQNAYGKGFVARTARRLSETPQSTQNKIVSYHFPHTTSPVTVSGFPIKTPPLVADAAIFDVIQKESFPPPVVAALPPKTQCPLASANSQCTNQSKQNAIKSLSSRISSVSPRPIIQTTSNSFNNNVVARPIPIDNPLPTVAPAAAAATANNNNLSAFNPIANNNQNTVVSDPSHASAGPNKGASASVGATTAPKRGRGVLSTGLGPGGRVPQCGSCSAQIR